MILYSYSLVLSIVLIKLLTSLKWWVYTTRSDLEPEGIFLWVEHRDLLPSPLILQAGHNWSRWCQLEHGSLACSLHAAGLTGFSSAVAKGFWTRVAIHVGSWCHCLPPLLTKPAGFVAQRLLCYDGFVTKSLLMHLSLMKASRIEQIIALPEKFIRWSG